MLFGKFCERRVLIEVCCMLFSTFRLSFLRRIDLFYKEEEEEEEEKPREKKSPNI